MLKGNRPHGAALGGMRFAICLIVLILIGCTDGEESFLEDRLDQRAEPQSGTILLALIGAEGSMTRR